MVNVRKRQRSKGNSPVSPAPVKPVKKAVAVEAPVASTVSDISIEDLIKVVAERMGYAPSKYQRGILEWIFGGSGNAAVNAVAGSGKSSSLRMVAIALEVAGVSPTDVRVIVFGKANAQELIHKFGKRWEQSVSTLHSAGWQICKKYFNIRNPRQAKIIESKYKLIAQELGYLRKRGQDKGQLVREKALGKEASFTQLIDLLRLTNNVDQNGVTVEQVEEIVDHFNVEEIHNAFVVTAAINDVLKVGIHQAQESKIFDYCDQVWLPIYFEMPVEEHKYVLVDECQDLNAVQLELAIQLAGKNGRMLFVGDPRQSIMGFAGADHESYEKILQRTDATELPLSTCYRCPILPIKLVNREFPSIPIESHSDASPGSLGVVNGKDLQDLLQEGDLVLSRKTAPLVSLCISLVAKGHAASVKGKDIGKSLISEIEAIAEIPGFKYESAQEAINAYEKQRGEKYIGLDNEEKLLEDLADHVSAIRSLFLDSPAKNLEELIEYVDSLFSDTVSPIALSTCHRAKGLEADTVYLYDPGCMPLTWKNQQDWVYKQEENLLYVALTRVKANLYFVLVERKKDGKKDDGYPSWLPLNLESWTQETLEGLTDPVVADALETFDLKTLEVETVTVIVADAVEPETEATEATETEVIEVVAEVADVVEPEEPTTVFPEREKVQIRSVVSILPGINLFHAAPLQRLYIKSETPTQLRVESAEGQKVNNVIQEKVYCLTSDQDWNEVMKLHRELEQAYKNLREKLTELGSYNERKFQGGKNGDNPITPYAIATASDDLNSTLGGYGAIWEDNFPLMFRLIDVEKHTAQMLRYTFTEGVDGNRSEFSSSTVTQIKGHFCCPTLEDWEEVKQLRQGIIDAGNNLYLYLKELGTYSQAKEEGRYLFSETPDLLEQQQQPEAKAKEPVATTPTVEAPTAKAQFQVGLKLPDVGIDIPPHAPIVNGAPDAQKLRPGTRVWINPATVRCDAGTQTRFKKTLPKKVEEYTESMVNGLFRWQDDVAPIYFDPEVGSFYPADAHHRLPAAQQAGFYLYVELRHGTLDDAVLESTSRNQWHGIQRTNKDKRSSAEVLLTSEKLLHLLSVKLGGGETDFPSNRQIAQYLGVSAPFIGNVIGDLAEEGKLALPPERVDANGRKLNTSKIGKDELDDDEEEETETSGSGGGGSGGSSSDKFRLPQKVKGLAHKVGFKVLVMALLDACDDHDEIMDIWEAVQELVS